MESTSPARIFLLSHAIALERFRSRDKHIKTRKGSVKDGGSPRLYNNTDNVIVSDSQIRGGKMSLGRVLVEEFQAEVLKWLRERVDLVVINPWVEPQRWELEVVRADAVISRKGKITREQMQRSGGRLKIIART